MRTKQKILRRIRTFYILFFVVIVASVVLSVTGNDFMTGFNDSIRDTQLTGNKLHTKHLFSLVNRTADRDHDIPVVVAPDSSIIAQARIQSFDLRIISTQKSGNNATTITSGLLMFAAIAAYLAIFIIIFIILNSLRSSVKTENVFERRNILFTRAIGILIICASVCLSLSSYCDAQYAATFMTGNSLVVNTSLSFTFSDIIMGILILFIAEVFAIGYDISQEQQFTI